MMYKKTLTKRIISDNGQVIAEAKSMILLHLRLQEENPDRSRRIQACMALLL